jgi:hypothetical protein
MDLREVGWQGQDWISLAQDRDKWWALVNIGVHKRRRIGLDQQLLAPREGFCSMELGTSEMFNIAAPLMTYCKEQRSMIRLEGSDAVKTNKIYAKFSV